MVDVAYFYYMPLCVLALVYAFFCGEKPIPRTDVIVSFIIIITTIAVAIAMSLFGYAVDALVIILTVVVVPAVEECVVRGLMYDMITAIANEKVAIFLTALIFSAWHAIAYPCISCLITIFGIALVLGYFRMKYSLYFCIVMHRMINTFGFVFSIATGCVFPF